jgi:mannan endo-1,4-beta-mannosidase
MHIWPLNWGWIKQNNIAATFDQAVEKTNQYMAKHIKVAEKLKKPIVLEEFGIPRDNYGFSPNDKIQLRDQYYENAFKQVLESAQNKGVLAGANFWAWGGFGRPVPNQVWYHRGDDYLGDPPCEEQGVNSVFSTDSTTACIIKYNHILESIEQ